MRHADVKEKGILIDEDKGFSCGNLERQDFKKMMKRGVMTKNAVQFTRFSIKAILQNPVYVVADGPVHDYF